MSTEMTHIDDDLLAFAESIKSHIDAAVNAISGKRVSMDAETQIYVQRELISASAELNRLSYAVGTLIGFGAAILHKGVKLTKIGGAPSSGRGIPPDPTIKP